jgi:hypothetical protein
MILTFPQKVYLSLVCCPENLVSTAPAYKVAYWRDLLLLLVPILGIPLFIVAVEGRWNSLPILTRSEFNKERE